jgi:hypothetical protein
LFKLIHPKRCLLNNNNERQCSTTGLFQIVAVLCARALGNKDK